MILYDRCMKSPVVEDGDALNLALRPEAAWPSELGPESACTSIHERQFGASMKIIAASLDADGRPGAGKGTYAAAFLNAVA